ncbi:MAG: hypothetical protein ACYCV4_03510 [Dermatophilaceae bacterium]
MVDLEHLASEHPDLLAVLKSAAALQRSVPDAVLVGGSVAAMYAGHRDSYDHDHVLADLMERYDAVLEAAESTEGWATNVRASSPPMTLMGSIGGIEAGLRQLRRKVPLETTLVTLPGGDEVTVPTLAEALRVKAYLVVQRNQVRDYLDVVALADRLGIQESANVLRHLDEYYLDRSGEDDSVVTALVQRLAEPNPNDIKVTRQLDRYKGLLPHWQDWGAVTTMCDTLAREVLQGGDL